MIYLSSLRRRLDHVRDPGRFPWSLPIMRELDSLDLRAANRVGSEMAELTGEEAELAASLADGYGRRNATGARGG